MANDVTDAKFADAVAYLRQLHDDLVERDFDMAIPHRDWSPGAVADYLDTLAARPEPEGMETTAEERGAMRGMYQPASLERRLLRDFDRLSAEVASLKARLAAAEAVKAETRKILVRCHDRIHALPRTSDTDLAIAIERLLGRLARGGRHEG